MYNNKFPIPPGFVVTAQAYEYFIKKSGLEEEMGKILESFDVEETEKLEEGTKKIRELMMNAEIPPEMKEEIKEAYDILDVGNKNIGKARAGAMDILRTGHEPPFVAVRSSATAEDLADASFAGQQDSFLNVKGLTDLINKVKECFASLFTARATYYRTKKKFSHLDTHLAVVVQKMIDSEKSGVMFSQNPVRTDGSILIEAVWGLGEGIVSGRIKPDSYVIDRNLEDFKIIDEQVSEKKVAIVRNSAGKNEIVKLTPERANQRVLSNYEIKRLAQYGKELEEHYKKPQDIEFAIESNQIYIVQSRPVTTTAKESTTGEISGEILLNGLGASPGVASGVVRIIEDLADLNKIKKGDVLVTRMTNPDMVVTMQKSAAIVTDEGGLTSHASIVSREMGIPAVVGTGNATEKLKDGEVITVDGNSGKVHEGRGETKLAEVKPIVQGTKIKIKVIVDLPDYAQRAALSGAKGIGLTRLEGIIAAGGKHPIAFVKENNMKAYVDILYNGLKKIVEPFEEMWVRSSDIRSDEYRHLEGAVKEVEGNPMLGDHGIRFSLRHPEIMKAELMAIKEIADDFPNKKIGIMFPQIISVAEIREAKRIAREDVNIPKNVKIGIMVETPASVQIINDLCEEGIDFISFGTNDLTQYTLAIDRNNGDVQYLFDEMSPAVLNSLAYVIRRCKKYNVESSICGQAGSRPEMVRFLVKEGIDSISVNADAAEKISKLVAELESGSAPVKEKSGGEPQLAVIGQKREDVESPAVESTEEKEVAPMVMEQKLNQDMEAAILKELGGDDYNPSYDDNKKKDIPPLNEAIPIESSHLESEEESKEFDFSDKNESEGEDSGDEEEDNSGDEDLKDDGFEENGKEPEKDEADETLGIF